jgi:hypothetical protein
MRDRALGIKRAKRVGGREGGIRRRVRVALELVNRVGRWTGVRWDGDWHFAKEGIGLFVSQALGLGHQRLEGLTVIDGSTRKECHRDEKSDGKGGGGS